MTASLVYTGLTLKRETKVKKKKRKWIVLENLPGTQTSCNSYAENIVEKLFD